jgi:hypothetical protein
VPPSFWGAIRSYWGYLFQDIIGKDNELYVTSKIPAHLDYESMDGVYFLSDRIIPAGCFARQDYLDYFVDFSPSR